MIAPLRLHQDIRFGREGNELGFVGDGWAAPEAHRRAIAGAQADMRLIHPGAVPMLLQIEAAPLGQAPAMKSAQLSVSANGAALGVLDIDGPRPRALAIPVGEAPADALLRLRLALPGVQAQARALALARLRLYVQGSGQTGRLPPGNAKAQPPSADMARFIECLGDGFGHAWRKAGAPVRHLLPGAQLTLAALLQGLEGDFAGLAERDQLTIVPAADGGLAARHGRMSLEIHGLDIPAAAAPEEQRGQAAQALWQMRRDMLRLLKAGGCIFVADGTPETALAMADILPVLIALNRFAPNVLLWLTAADEDNPAGTVEWTLPGLLRGYVGQRPGHRGWVALCTNALILAQPWLTRPAPALAAPKHAAPEPLPPPGPAPPFPAAASSPHPQAVADRAPSPPAEPVDPCHGYALIQEVAFGDGGNDAATLGFGWSTSERGFRWTDGDEAALVLRHPGPGPVILAVAAWPHTSPPGLLSQRLVLSADETPIATFRFDNEACFAAPFVMPVGAAHSHFTLTCALPDARRPSELSRSDDRRQLGLAFMRLALHRMPAPAAAMRAGTGGWDIAAASAAARLPAEELACRFESLGGSQHFQSVQEACGAQPLTLFGDAEIALHQLARLLANRLAGVGTLENLVSSIQHGTADTYAIEERAASFRYVTAQSAGQIDAETLRLHHSRRIRLLREQLLEDAARGERIFVYHRPANQPPLQEDAVLPLFLALRRLGPNTLLYVTPADDSHPPGTVETHWPGLLHGYVAAQEALSSWLEVCVNARMLRQPAAG